jgi:hypothetical protein
MDDLFGGSSLRGRAKGEPSGLLMPVTRQSPRRVNARTAALKS